MLNNHIFLFIFFLSFLSRLIFIIFFPETGGDSEIFITVAKNILRGCGVSLSDPASNECIPHFGGNHGPGYDIFMASVWFLFDQSNNAVRIIQALIYSFFAVYLLSSLQRYIKKKTYLIIIGITLSLSPMLIAWPRYLQTETISIALTLFTLSELIISFSQKKVRVLSIALALTLATWVRLDNIFLTIPVAVTCFYLHGLKKGLVHGFFIAVMLSASWGVWTIRNISVDLPSLFPTNMIMPDGTRSPTGYLKWTNTWITNEYEKPSSLWGINRKNYLNISIPESAYFDEDEKEKVQKLLYDLKSFNGKPFPKEIDDQFDLIADVKSSNYPLKVWIKNPLKRIYKMWTNPYSSFGWPNEIPSEGLSHEERLNFTDESLSTIFSIIEKYPYRSISKAINAIYRFILTLLFIYFFILVFLSKNFKSKEKKFLSFLGLICIFYLIGRTVFFSINSYFETRYLVSIIPFIEVFTILALLEKFSNKPIDLKQS